MLSCNYKKYYKKCYQLCRCFYSSDDRDYKLLPKSEIETKHYEIYSKYLSKYDFIKQLSKSTYKINYNNNFCTIKIIYKDSDFLNQLLIADLLKDTLKTNRMIENKKFSKDVVMKGGIIIYKYIPGIDLWQYINNLDKGLPEIKAKKIIKSLLCSLKNIHDKNIIHSDIKLENVVCLNNNPYESNLIDYDLASILDIEETSLKCKIEGTIPFIAPEIVKTRRKCKKSDVWSLGCLTYILLFHKHLLTNDKCNFMKTIQNIEPYLENIKSEIKGIVSPECFDFLFNMLAENLEKRNNVDTLLKHQWIIN